MVFAVVIKDLRPGHLIKPKRFDNSSSNLAPELVCLGRRYFGAVVFEANKSKKFSGPSIWHAQRILPDPVKALNGCEIGGCQRLRKAWRPSDGSLLLRGAELFAGGGVCDPENRAEPILPLRRNSNNLKRKRGPDNWVGRVDDCIRDIEESKLF